MGDLVDFPLAPQRPSENAPTYWQAAGSLFRNVAGRGVFMSPEEARRRRYQHEQDAMRLWNVRDVQAAREAAAMWTQLTGALDALEDWERMPGSSRVRGQFEASVALTNTIENRS